jgi:high-affinity nickel-transport protein
LKFLFTAGMTLVDSIDSILMLYSYSAFPESGWAILERSTPETGTRASTMVEEGDRSLHVTEPASITRSVNTVPLDDGRPFSVRSKSSEVIQPETNEKIQELRVKRNVMAELSLILTLMSILVAFR